jgi:hypothetical protein
MPIIPAFKTLEQEDSEFEASLGYVSGILSKKKKRGRERKREGRRDDLLKSPQALSHSFFHFSQLLLSPPRVRV